VDLEFPRPTNRSIIINIFNQKDLSEFDQFKFLPQTDDDRVEMMGEKWEMVLSQKNRVSIWRFIGQKTEWYCMDLFVGDRCDSFEMEQFEDMTWTRTQTLWLSTLDEVIQFVGVLAKLDIDEGC